jgi:hypothetical protein
MKKILRAVSLFGLLGVAVANNFGDDEKDKKKCCSKKSKKECCSKKESKSCSKDKEADKTAAPETKPTEDKK